MHCIHHQSIEWAITSFPSCLVNTHTQNETIKPNGCSYGKWVLATAVNSGKQIYFEC